MVLAYALIQYQKFNFVNFKIVPAILDLGFPGFDAKEMKEFFNKLGVELKVVDCTDVYKILSQHKTNDGKLPCSICSRMKKAAINKAATELGCNKVAFAHHIDDALETLFMNQIFGGRIATFQPKMHLERANIDFIRPLILATEDDIRTCQKEENIPAFPSHCPNDGITMRADMKSLLKDIYKKYPKAKENFASMLNNYEKEVLFYDQMFIKIERKDISLKPVISANDALIEQEIRYKKNLVNFKVNLKRFVIYKKTKPIGIFSYSLNDHNAYINDLVLIKDSDKTWETLFVFIENMLLRATYPLDLSIKENIHCSFLKDRGYTKLKGKYTKHLE